MRVTAPFLLLVFPTVLSSAAAPIPKTKPSHELVVVSVTDNKWQIHLISMVTGEKKQLSDNTESDLYPTWSPDGKRIAFMSYRNGRDVWTMKADGSDLKRMTKNALCARPPRWSPDGSRIAFLEAARGVCIVEIATGKATNLELVGDPDWSPDSKKLAYARGGGDSCVFVENADGTNSTKLSENLGGSHPVWSPDGNQLAFVARCPTNNSWQVYTIGADGKNQKQITKDMTIDYRVQPRWSPDGTRIALSVLVGDKLQVAVMRADGSNVKVITSKYTHADIRWSPDGKLLSYTRSDDRLQSVVVVSDPEGESERELFRGGYCAEWKPK